MENEYYGIYLDDGLPSPSVESTRRELFEDWYTCKGTTGRLISTDCGNYISELAQNCWEAFNASLDAVEIELPAKLLRVEHDKDWHGVRNGTISACQRSIESLNLGLKIK